MKAISPKWELSVSIRSGHLTLTKRRSEHEQQRQQDAIVQTSPIIIQGNLIQYSRFRWETASMCNPGSTDLTSVASLLLCVLEANSTPNIIPFTCATPMFDTLMFK